MESAPYNRYGMPNGNYAQGAPRPHNFQAEVRPERISLGAANPIVAGAQQAQAPHVGNPEMPAAPGSPVTRDGFVNLSMPPPQTNYFAGAGEIGSGAAPPPPVFPAGFEAAVGQAQQGLAPVSASLDPIIAALNGQGYNVKRATHAGNLPSDDKITFGDGTGIDMITGVGDPNAGWGYQPYGPQAPKAGNSALMSALMGGSYSNSTMQQIMQSLALSNALK